MSQEQIVQIRKLGGLDKIIINKNSRLKPMLYQTLTKDKNEEGIPQGEYKGKSILDTKYFLAPHWDDLKNQYSWAGTIQELSLLIDAMKLRYRKGHERAGQLIKSNPETDGDRLFNRKDEVFTHDALYGKYYMENGRISLNPSDPKQKFLHLCYKNSSRTIDKSAEEKLNPYIAAGAIYEMVSPKKENQNLKKTAMKEVTAFAALGAMADDEDKLRAICTIMSIPGFSPTSDTAGMFVLLKNTVVQNTSFSAKYGKSAQDRFVELAEMDTEELNVTYQVISAKNRGIIRKRPGHYLFNGDKLEGLENDLHLIAYFKNPKNQDRYVELLGLIEPGT